MTYRRHHGLRKICGCPRRRWTVCVHAWHLNYRWFRGSLDKEAGRHLATKEAADEFAADIRAAIDAGTFAPRTHRIDSPDVTTPPAAMAPPTLAQLGERYFREIRNRRTGEPLGRNERYRWDIAMRTVITRSNGQSLALSELPAHQVTHHDLEAFKVQHATPHTIEIRDARGRRYHRQVGGQVGANRCLGRLRAFYNWAVRHDHVPASPFMKQHLTVVQMYGELPRDRRLLEGEEAKLLATAPPRLRDLIIAALESGCRIGELSGLQWFQVRWDLNEVHLRLKTTKGKKPRALPISQRLRAVLELRRHAPDGALHPPQAFVFGNEVGEQIKDSKKAWEATLLKAYGHEITYTKTGALTPELRQALRAIDLHRHDLRREAGSSLMEHGMPGRYIQEFLDHANLSTTSRYLKGTQSGLHAALHAVEARRAQTNCKNLQDLEPASDGPADGATQQPLTKQ